MSNRRGQLHDFDRFRQIVENILLLQPFLNLAGTLL